MRHNWEENSVVLCTACVPRNSMRVQRARDSITTMQTFGRELKQMMNAWRSTTKSKVYARARACVYAHKVRMCARWAQEGQVHCVTSPRAITEYGFSASLYGTGFSLDQFLTFTRVITFFLPRCQWACKQVGANCNRCRVPYSQRSRSRFLKHFRSHLTRSLSKVKSELGPTYDVLRTGFRCAGNARKIVWFGGLCM